MFINHQQKSNDEVGLVSRTDDDSIRLFKRLLHIGNTVLGDIPIIVLNASCTHGYPSTWCVLATYRGLPLSLEMKMGCPATISYTHSTWTLSAFIQTFEPNDSVAVAENPTPPVDVTTHYEAGASVATGGPGELVIAKRDIKMGDKFNPRDRMKWHNPKDIFQVWSAEESHSIVCTMDRFKEAVEQYVQETIRDTGCRPSAEVVHIKPPTWDGNDFRVVFYYLEGDYEGEGETSRTLYFNLMESFI